MKEMREKVEERQAMLAVAKSVTVKEQEIVGATKEGSTIDQKLVNTLESFTGVKDRALLIATLRKFHSDMQLSADHILMHDLNSLV